MEAERAVDTHISLYPEQINNVKIYAKHKNYKSISQAYQHIINRFFNIDDKNIRTDFILFLIVPSLFCILTTIVNLSTGKVYDMLLREGVFFDELFLLSRVFMVISFGSIGILIACVYWLRRKLVERNSFKKELKTDGIAD